MLLYVCFNLIQVFMDIHGMIISSPIELLIHPILFPLRCRSGDIY